MTDPPLPPLRLPPGWAAVPAPPGVRAAAGPQRLPLGRESSAVPLVSVADWSEGDATDLAAAVAGLHAALARDADDVQLLDAGPVRLADGRPAHRSLTACCGGDGVGRTVEQWATPVEVGCLVLNASAPTPMWPWLGARLQRVLRSAGHTPTGPPPPLPEDDENLSLPLPPPAELSVLLGEDGSSLHRADGLVRGSLPDGVVLDDLPLALLPHWLAAAAQLGPRPVVAVGGLVLSEPARIDALAAGDPEPLAKELTGAWSVAVRALGAVPPRRLAVRQPAGTVDLLDGGAAGLWSTWSDGEVTGLRPVTTTESWSALIAACCS